MRYRGIIHLLFICVMIYGLGAFADRVVTAQPQPESASTQARGITKPATDPWGTFTQISAGTSVIDRFTCALNSSGNAYCWGHSRRGELGNGTNDGSESPVAVTMPAGVTFTAITSGNYLVCALASTGAAYCWGNPIGVGLGNGATTSSNVPVAVTMPAGVTFTAIETSSTLAGSPHTCALASSGNVYCWGGEPLWTTW
jgi:alpha-tubulin suppressor-like RCC1 family protein